MSGTPSLLYKAIMWSWVPQDTGSCLSRTCELVPLVEEMYSAVLTEALAQDAEVEDAVGEIFSALDDRVLLAWISPDVAPLETSQSDRIYACRNLSEIDKGLTLAQMLQLHSMILSSLIEMSHVSKGLSLTASVTAPQWQLP